MFITIIDIAHSSAMRVFKIIPAHLYFRFSPPSNTDIIFNTRVAMYIFIVDIARFCAHFYTINGQIKRIWGCSSEQPQIVLYGKIGITRSLFASISNGNRRSRNHRRTRAHRNRHRSHRSRSHPVMQDPLELHHAPQQPQPRSSRSYLPLGG